MFLDAFHLSKMPLLYGSASCCLALNDSRYTKEVVQLRNDPSVNAYIHNEPLTPAKHEGWLGRQLLGDDSINFAVLIHNEFKGTVALYDIQPGQGCEYGRLVMKHDATRIYAVAVEFLCLSFAFDILQLREIYCRVVESNTTVMKLHKWSGWSNDDRYTCVLPLNGAQVKHIGFSLQRGVWPECFNKARPLIARLHNGRSRPVVYPGPSEIVSQSCCIGANQ